MPELPEVETIRMGLEKYLVGHRVASIDVRHPKIVTGDTKYIVDTQVIAVRRFGKGLVIDFSNGYSLAVHIKMTGQLIYQQKKISRVSKAKIGKELPNKWTHVLFHLDRGAVLYYNDIRQFGWMKVVQTSDIKQLPFFKDLGPEPPVTGVYSSGEVKVESGSNSSRHHPKDDRPMDEARTILTVEVFTEIVKKAKGPVKPLLMDQKEIAGVGNIYANEALFVAYIDPRKIAQALSNEEIKELYDALLVVLKKGIAYGGASEVNFVNALGEQGTYQDHLLVYGKTGKPCLNCGDTIERMKLGGRGTFFCPTCQR